MPVEFKTTKTSGTFLSSRQFQALAINIADFENYLVKKYDFISKMDMLLTEKEARIQHHLNVNQAITAWNRVNGDRKMNK